jgi:hypothetical protein
MASPVSPQATRSDASGIARSQDRHSEIVLSDPLLWEYRPQKPSPGTRGATSMTIKNKGHNSTLVVGGASRPETKSVHTIILLLVRNRR